MMLRAAAGDLLVLSEESTDTGTPARVVRGDCVGAEREG